MEGIAFANLNEFVTQYSNNVKIIKEKFIALLSQLTIASDLSIETFLENLKRIHDCGIIRVGYVGIPGDSEFRIVCSGTIIIEPKIIRGGKSVGHIEDIVVLDDFRGLGLSGLILEYLRQYGVSNNCYKLILDCDEKVCKVYEKNNYVVKGLQMALYLE